MAETLASRVGRLISGTANSLVDAIENAAPEIVMEQALREIDQAIDDVRAELGTVVARNHMATRRLVDENRKHGDLTEKTKLALYEGREDLAKTAVSQILDIEGQIPILEATISETKDEEAKLESYIVALQGRRREMKDELGAFRAAQTASARSESAGSATPAASGGVAGTVRDAERAFERAMEGGGGIAGTPLPDPDTAAKQAELDDLAHQKKITDRLAAIRKEID